MSTLMTYAKRNNKDSQMFKSELENYLDYYYCFDSSVVFKLKGILYNLVILELGGSSDLYIRIIESCNELDVIDIEDFFDWLYEFKTSGKSCNECVNMTQYIQENKLNAYTCDKYNDRVYPYRSFMDKWDKKIYPCGDCRRDRYKKRTCRPIL